MTTATSDPAPTYRQVLGEPRFRALFASRSVAVAADSQRTVALSVLIFEVTGSAFLAALTYGISFIPQVIGGMFLGSLADRLPARPILVGAYLLEFTSASVLALARPPVALSLTLVAVVACFTPVFTGTSNRLVAEVLTGQSYVLGRSLSNIAASVAQILGLALGGVTVAAMGSRNALLVSAGAYLAAAVIARSGLPTFAATAIGDANRSVVAESLRANLALLSNRPVRTLLLVQWLPPAFVVGAESLVIPYAASRGRPDAGGLLLACMPAGMIIGNYLVGRYLPTRLHRRATAPLMMLLGVPLLAFALPLPVPVAAVVLVVTGSGFGYGLCVQQQFLDVVPEPLRGVAFGLLATGVMTLQGLGPTAFGGLSELVGVPESMATAGAVTIIGAIVLGRLVAHNLSVGTSPHLEEVIDMLDESEEIPLLGGDVTEGLVKVGRTVRRPWQPQSDAVVSYLTFLAEQSFDASPRWRGRDARGRDVVDYIEGDVPATPPEAWAMDSSVLVDMGRLLRRLHDVSQDFSPDMSLPWFGQGLVADVPSDMQRLFDTPELVTHCDVTPQNTVFRDGRPIALIDFDVCRPTTRLLDVLDTATWWVPLVAPVDRAPSQRDLDVPARLKLFVDAYGLDSARRAQFLDLAHRAARRSWYLMEASARQQGGGWARMWSDGVGFWIQRRQEWLLSQHDTLAAVLALPAADTSTSALASPQSPPASAR